MIKILKSIIPELLLAASISLGVASAISIGKSCNIKPSPAEIAANGAKYRLRNISENLRCATKELSYKSSTREGVPIFYTYSPFYPNARKAKTYIAEAMQDLSGFEQKVELDPYNPRTLEQLSAVHASLPDEDHIKTFDGKPVSDETFPTQVAQLDEASNVISRRAFAYEKFAESMKLKRDSSLYGFGLGLSVVGVTFAAVRYAERSENPSKAKK